MIKLSVDEIEILGRPNFACARVAKLLIEHAVYEKGSEKSEYEQAVFIHWASGLLKMHGSNWKKEADEILTNLQKQPGWLRDSNTKSKSEVQP